MRSRRSGVVVPKDFPPSLRRIVLAADRECPRGHADALSELAVLALDKVPSRGIFDPAVRGEHDLFTAIEAVAMRHLALREARSSWRTALDAAGLSFDVRSEIEAAGLQMQSASDSSYFYTGLAFGLVWLSAYRVG